MPDAIDCCVNNLIAVRVLESIETASIARALDNRCRTPSGRRLLVLNVDQTIRLERGAIIIKGIRRRQPCKAPLVVDCEARVAVTGAGQEGVFRAASIEDALSGDFSAAAVDGATVPTDDLMNDMHADPEYRANLIKVMAKRAVDRANGQG